MFYDGCMCLHYCVFFCVLLSLFCSCGGGGSCGTCAVDVVEGMQNCNPKGPAEKKLLGNKKESIRLSCCTRVTGPVTIKTKP
jgi:ferredoxin